MGLQYVAGRLCDVLEQLNRTTNSNLSSTAFPDCCALMNLAMAVAAIVGSLVVAVGLVMHSLILPGVATLVAGAVAFFICGYLAIVCVNLAALNISITPEVRAGEEAIGVATYSLKVFLRLVPVAFGAGVICGVVMLGYACYQVIAGEPAASGAIAALMPSESIADGAGYTLLWSAALPLAAYLLFLLYCLLIEVCRAFLILPGKIDKLAATSEEKKTGQ